MDPAKFGKFFKTMTETLGEDKMQEVVNEAQKDTMKQVTRAEEMRALRQQNCDAQTLDKLLAKRVREAEDSRRQFATHVGAIAGFTHPSGRLERPHQQSSTTTGLGRPISARALRQDAQHPGRVLRGSVVSPPVVIQSAQFLLRDERGSIVPVSVYGTSIPPPGDPRCLVGRCR